MRSLLTGGIKAILAVAALSTAVHWALRLQREPGGLVSAAYASLPDPETTGSIAPRQAAPPALDPRPATAAVPVPAPAPVAKAARAAPVGLDQSHLAALVATATGAAKAKAAKVAKR
ncbi:hypothetical protein [Methylobacterium sp. J-076]|uniref:hypothetical protein n=1 Tax=Methylobacterium sp. J-076 TaxID=2836655 RepID=UPI001FBB2087|nr:hypothetical protein [Methylobacterium sp. J-076]MCJ2011600.1 hypothetical protein [Methylobacterium sp. J-076]